MAREYDGLNTGADRMVMKFLGAVVDRGVGACFALQIVVTVAATLLAVLARNAIIAGML